MGLPRTVRMEHWHGLKITSKIGWSADVIRLTGHPSHLILTSLTSIYGGSSKSIREQAKDNKWFEIAIGHKIRSVPQHQCERVIENFKRRIDVCIQRGGRHLEHTLWKSRSESFTLSKAFDLFNWFDFCERITKYFDITFTNFQLKINKTDGIRAIHSGLDFLGHSVNTCMKCQLLYI